MWPAKQNIVFFEIFGFGKLLDYHPSHVVHLDDGDTDVKCLS